MVRPKICRQLQAKVPCSCFKPNGIPSYQLAALELLKDEFEALQLADVQKLHQQQAAEQMGISRQTFGNLIASARYKTALAITTGMRLNLPKDE